MPDGPVMHCTNCKITTCQAVPSLTWPQLLPMGRAAVMHTRTPSDRHRMCEQSAQQSKWPPRMPKHHRACALAM